MADEELSFKEVLEKIRRKKRATKNGKPEFKTYDVIDLKIDILSITYLLNNLIKCGFRCFF